MFKPDNPPAPEISIDQFFETDIRVGTIINASLFLEAHKPAYKLTIDFGPAIGTKKSSSQITELQSVEDLNGTKIIAVVNFPPKQIGPFMSEVLVLGLADEDGKILALKVDSSIPNGARLA